MWMSSQASPQRMGVSPGPSVPTPPHEMARRSAELNMACRRATDLTPRDHHRGNSRATLGRRTPTGSCIADTERLSVRSSRISTNALTSADLLSNGAFTCMILYFAASRNRPTRPRAGASGTTTDNKVTAFVHSTRYRGRLTRRLPYQSPRALDPDRAPGGASSEPPSRDSNRCVQRRLIIEESHPQC